MLISQKGFHGNLSHQAELNVSIVRCAENANMNKNMRAAICPTHTYIRKCFTHTDNWGLSAQWSVPSTPMKFKQMQVELMLGPKPEQRQQRKRRCRRKENIKACASFRYAH